MVDSKIYNPRALGGETEESLHKKFTLHRDDAKLYFQNCIKPRLDRSYKLYISDTSDRAREIKAWQANVSVPYIHAVVETLKPRILDARPEFTVQGRNMDDHLKAPKLQQLADYTWEVSNADKTTEMVVSSALVYGTGFLQVYWKKDVRKAKFLKGKDINSNKYKWETQEKTYYDAPYVEHVDNYSLLYDWHNINAESKQYWFKRLLLTEAEIKRRYPMAEESRIKMAINSGAGVTDDWASVRNEVKLNHTSIMRGVSTGVNVGNGVSSDIYTRSEIKVHEVYEAHWPFEDEYAVFVNDVPILSGAVIPLPYDFKESMFIDIPYLKLPGEFEGYGVPMILENPQIMLNTIKNQRLDAATLNIHKSWIVSPSANVKKEDLVIKPFGIIWSNDPGAVREVQMSDVKPSAYREEELLKSDMRYSSGVDDFSMGVGGGGSSATEVRHLRESTLERIRLFINHLADGYSKVLRYWISMYSQFFTEKMMIRIAGTDGEIKFPLIEKDDLYGQFDYKATILPSIAGMNDIKKKQDMDLFQLLMNMSFIDQQKLVSKILLDWNWDIASISKEQEAPAGLEAGIMPVEGEMIQNEVPGGGVIPAEIANEILGTASQQSPMAELSAPVNLLEGSVPPTVQGVRTPNTTNPRGLNRTGRVNTNIPTRDTSNPEASLQNRALNIQR